MAAGTGDVRIAPPAWARAWLVAFPAIWTWVWLTRIEAGGPVGWLAFGLGLALCARMLLMGAVGTADGRLTVRNQLSTRTFRREELADAVVDRANGPTGVGWAVFLVAHDGARHQVQTTQVPFRRLLGHVLERDCARLRDWIRSGGRPAPPSESDTR